MRLWRGPCQLSRRPSGHSAFSPSGCRDRLALFLVGREWGEEMLVLWTLGVLRCSCSAGPCAWTVPCLVQEEVGQTWGAHLSVSSWSLTTRLLSPWCPSAPVYQESVWFPWWAGSGGKRQLWAAVGSCGRWPLRDLRGKGIVTGFCFSGRIGVTAERLLPWAPLHSGVDTG